MAAKRYVDLIDELFNYIEGCEKKMFSNDKVVVEKDVVFGILDELRTATPDEIKRCQKIIGSREAIFNQTNADAEGIINEAKKKAEDIEEEARINAQHLIDESEIMRKAFEQANNVVQNAQAEADSMRASAKNYAESIKTGALNYAETIMNDMNQQLSAAYLDAKKYSEALISSLKGHLVEVEHNHEELRDVIDNYKGEPEFIGGEQDNDEDMEYENPDEEAQEEYEAAEGSSEEEMLLEEELSGEEMVYEEEMDYEDSENENK